MTPLSSGSKLAVCMPVPPIGKNQGSCYYSLGIREESGSQKVHKDFLMTPIAKTEPSIDASFTSLTYSTLFKMTVGDHHPFNFRGLNKVVSNLPANAQKGIHIMFTILRGTSGEEFRGVRSTQHPSAYGHS